MPRRNHVERLSAFFERVGIWSFDHRSIVLAACVAALAASAWIAGGVRFDNSLEAFFDTDDTSYAEYLRYRDDFGSDEISYILYEAPDDPNGIFGIDVMRKLQLLTAALETEVPFISEVTSLANVEYIEGYAGGIAISELLEEFPADQVAMLDIRAKVLSKPLYVGGLVTADGSLGAIIVEMDRSSIDPLDEIRLDPEGGDGIANLYPQVTNTAIDSILERPEYTGMVFHHVGDVPLNARYNEVIESESGLLAGLALLVISALLFAFFRRPIGVIGPMAVVFLSIMVCVAFIVSMGWRMDMMFIMVPTLLIAVGVADAVHIIAEFRAYHVLLGDRREAARRTLALVGPPCLLTSVTTATGFAAMAVAPIKAISHLAVYSAVGVLAAFLLSITLLFVLLSFGRRHPSRESGEREKMLAKGGVRFQAFLAGVTRFVIARRRAILAVSAGLFLAAGAGIARLEVDSNFLHEFRPDDPLRVAVEYVDEVMGGMFSFVYVFDSGEAEGIKEPALLREIDRVQKTAAQETDLVKKTYSIADVLMDLNRSFHADDPAYAILPESRELVAQYLLLYEMSGGADMPDYATSDFSRANLELRLKAVASSEIKDFAARLNAYIAENPVEASAIHITGMGALWLQLMDYITQSQIRGFLLAFAVITALLCFIFQSVKIGLIAMVPNLAPVILTLGVMGWIELPLDYLRLLIASVAIGIAVDDTIHHVTRFGIEFRRCGNYHEALHASMSEVGRALIITSVVLVLGFLMFRLSAMEGLASFGSLLAGTITVALVADFLLMPALLLTLKPFGPERKPESVASRVG